MDSSKKVVPINNGRLGATAMATDESHLFARIPAPFVEMKDKGKQVLQSLLHTLFDNIDDALFELADRAEQNNEQNMYFESMREIRIKRRGMEIAFGRALDEAFLQLLGDAIPTLSEGGAQSEAGDSTAIPTLSDGMNIPTLSNGDGFDAEHLSLVDNNDLEELIAAESMISKAERQYAAALRQLNIRLDSMVENQAVSDKNNPFGPAAICKSFIDVCGGLDLGIKAKLVLFKLFDRYVMHDLGKVYALCNQVLIEGGILPNLHQSRQKASQAPVAPQPAPAAPVAGDNGDVFADLQALLHSQSQPSADVGNGLVAPGQGPQIPRDTLLQLLQVVQQSASARLDEQQRQALTGVVPAQLDVPQVLSRLLVERMPSQAVSIGQVDSDAINLVAMLFQFILDDRNLAAPIKALIARLQIPIIKVAMVDKSFFSKGGHPARKLLNEIANAALGWVPGAALERDPFYLKVSEIVDRLLNEFEGDPGIFQDILTDFITFVEMDKRRAELVEQRTVNAEDGKARSEVARGAVQALLNEKVAGKTLPKVVITLLEDAWSNVMFLVWLKEGEDSGEWRGMVQLVDDLLWSVQPKEDAGSRQRLLRMVPELLKTLRAGLTSIGYNPFEMNQLFADLEAIHLALLKEVNTAPAEHLAKPASRAAQTRVIQQTLDQMLDGHDDGGVSIEQLDAELDQQLAELDSATDLADNTVEGDKAAAVATEGSGESWEVVDRLNISGAVDDKPRQDVELEEGDPCLQRVDAMTMGNWVELHQEEGKKFRCRLAAIIRGADKYIFVNRSGMKVAEYNRMSLALAIKQNKVTTLDEGLLFDRALESVIGNLRDMKAKPA